MICILHLQLAYTVRKNRYAPRNLLPRAGWGGTGATPHWHPLCMLKPPSPLLPTIRMPWESLALPWEPRHKACSPSAAFQEPGPAPHEAGGGGAALPCKDRSAGLHASACSRRLWGRGHHRARQWDLHTSKPQTRGLPCVCQPALEMIQATAIVRP